MKVPSLVHGFLHTTLYRLQSQYRAVVSIEPSYVLVQSWSFTMCEEISTVAIKPLGPKYGHNFYDIQHHTIMFNALCASCGSQVR